MKYVLSVKIEVDPDEEETRDQGFYEPAEMEFVFEAPADALFEASPSKSGTWTFDEEVYASLFFSYFTGGGSGVGFPNLEWPTRPTHDLVHNLDHVFGRENVIVVDDEPVDPDWQMRFHNATDEEVIFLHVALGGGLAEADGVKEDIREAGRRLHNAIDLEIRHRGLSVEDSWE